MASIVKNACKGIKGKGIVNFIKYLKDEGYTKCLLDGNLLQEKIHKSGARLVGVDKFGNKYYEKLENTQFGRHRWVEYAKKGRYDASQVPPEWHGWLHYMTDHTGDEVLLLKPSRYGLEHRENLTGEGYEYANHSKGYLPRPGHKDWSCYEPWQPTKT